MPGADASIGGVLSALERHPSAQAVLAPALAPGGRPSHAYLFHGPGGAGKRSAARAMAAELLAEDSLDPASARARVASGSHPDLTWVSPSGAHEILVSDIDAPVIAAASKTPFEASRRVFVIERVDELGDEAANRMLKTLEEPPSFVHLILLTDRLVEVLPTIRSRCQLVRFDSPGIERIAEELRADGADDRTADACARLSLGDTGRARELASDEGAALRTGAERIARAVLAGEVGGSQPWVELLRSVRARGETVRTELEASAGAEIELYPRKERKRIETEWSDRARRARRRTETAALDLGLSLVSLWFADLICAELGASELIRHTDRLAELEADGGQNPQRLRKAIELVEDTRQRFQLNVSEDLACEALCYRLERAIAR
jgi:DNA polymerase-3 subunit delta'